jgi:hypothetical protein
LKALSASQVHGNNRLESGDLRRIAEWEERRQEIRRLLDEAVEALSPARLFEEPPLCTAPSWVRSWLPVVLQGCYLQYGPVPFGAANARKLLEAADQEYERLRANLATGNCQQEDLGACLDRLRSAVEDLSVALSSLPHQVWLR